MSDLPTILLAEDDPNDVVLVQRAIRRANIANPVDVVGDGDAAVTYLSARLGSGGSTEADPPSGLPALVLLDLKMPRRSGFEVLEWIRASDALRLLPVVVLTSSRESSDVQRAYELGANSYLVKPGAPDDLLVLVRTLGLYWLVLNEPPETPR